ncbi:MAG: DUF4349 domain-containing protein [Anaerolineae bacterium]|nr:DUF4349 domain-containing protein [Anaerolineae bacterium]
MKILTNFFCPCLRWSRRLLILVILPGLTVACGAMRASTPVYDSVANAPAMAPPPQAQEVVVSEVEVEYAADSGGAGYDGSAAINAALANATAQAQTQTRVIIYTGDMALVVKDTREAIAAITQLVEEKGGYVSGSNIYQSGDVPRGSITIRFPAELYQEMLVDLRGLAIRVERESSNTQDVTEEYTDLQARKTNLEYTEKALQELLDERKRTGSTNDILEVYRELTNIRGQIEQIEGRLRYLTNQAALSTISIELIPDVLYQPVSVAGWEPQGVAKEALQTLVVALQGLVNLTIWLVILILPLLIIVLIPVVVVVMIIRWWWKRRKAKKQSPVKKEDE